jgi:hypothetical protein
MIADEKIQDNCRYRRRDICDYLFHLILRSSLCAVNRTQMASLRETKVTTSLLLVIALLQEGGGIVDIL